MNSPNNNPATQSGRATRSSLACLPCRLRHLKCDGKKPHCSRCTEATRECHYARSRRGGLDRAALAERRKRLAAAEDVIPSTGNIERFPPSQQVQALVAQNSEHTTLFSVTDTTDCHDILVGVGIGAEFPSAILPKSPPAQGVNIEDDALVDLYYNNFHKFHPFILPRKHLIRFCQDPSKKASFEPLVAVIRFIGHIYGSLEWSTTLKDAVENCFSQELQNDPIMVQSRLLYSIPLFWHGYRADSKREMDIAIRLALDLGMFRREFAAEQGEDPVMKESWRRTWWMVFIIDAYYAGTLGAMNFATIHVETTVELPCEEAEYESGEIPEPRTLEEFDCREFADDNTSFSSFAYLITAVRCAALAISIAPKIAVKEASPQVIESADSIVDAWLLLLPKNEKQVMSKTGEIDELMFQAHLVIHVATIGLHRPLSDLRFNTVEGVSSCARDPPAEIPTPDLINIHTTRVLRSVEAQIRLLTLPARPFKHTPFTTCMVSEGTLALLSACNFLLKGKELAIARDQIRMTIGCLKSLGEVWPRTARNVREIQTIARHVLGLGSKTGNSNTPRSNQVPSLAGSEGQETLSSENGLSSSENDVFSSLGTLDSVCGWHNLNDLPLDLSWWTEEG